MLSLVRISPRTEGKDTKKFGNKRTLSKKTENKWGFIWKICKFCLSLLRERFMKMPSDFTFNEMQPHPGNIMKEYAMKQVLDDLREAGLIK